MGLQKGEFLRIPVVPGIQEGCYLEDLLQGFRQQSFEGLLAIQIFAFSKSYGIPLRALGLGRIYLIIHPLEMPL